MPNHRQVAMLIWLAVILILIIWYPKLRPSVKQILATAAHPKILVPLAALLAYVTGLLFLGRLLGLWRPSLLTDTIFWWAGTALVLFLNMDRTWRTQRFFRRTALGTVGVAALIEFFINDLFVFSFPTELFLVPIITTLVMISAFAGHQPQGESLKRGIDGFLGVVGFVLAGYVVLRAASEWTTLDKVEVLRSFVLPVWLTIAVLPFFYALGLYAVYDLAFTWIDFRADSGSRWRAKLALVLRLRGHMRDVGGFNIPWGQELAETSSFRDSWRVAREFRESLRERERTEAKKLEDRERFAGIDGVDEEGRRLDQREFEETKEALQRLASAQMGWYQNQGGRYRPDLLEILVPQFEHAGLPSEHGIELHVSRDGQAWWAWRRTLTGWGFAIGAAGPPPDEWLFDGPEPPRGFPGKSDEWGERWGTGALNW